MVFLLFFKILAEFIFLYCRFLVNLQSEMRQKCVHLEVSVYNQHITNRLRKISGQYPPKTQNVRTNPHIQLYKY